MSINTTFTQDFSSAVLFGASQTTLHSVLTCAVLSQEYLDNIEQVFFLYIVVWTIKGNTAQHFYMCNIVPSVMS